MAVLVPYCVAVSVVASMLLPGCHHAAPLTSYPSLPAINVFPPPREPVASEDSVLLSSLLAAEKDGARQGYVIARETIPLDTFRKGLSYDMHRRRHPQKESREAFDDFARRNKSASVSPPLNVGAPLTYKSRNEIAAVFKHGSWASFYKKFPHTGGIVAFCLPGYSANRHLTIVYFERRWGGRAGWGSLMLMAKKAGVWKIKETLTGWQS